jgi:hypothetical protein
VLQRSGVSDSRFGWHVKCFMLVVFAALFSSLASGCFLPTDERRLDGGMVEEPDGGVIFLPDAGPTFVDCSDFPMENQGCTHYSGWLQGVGFGPGFLAPASEGGDDVVYDSSDGNLSLLRTVDGGVTIGGLIVSKGLRGLGSLEMVSGSFQLLTGPVTSFSGLARLKEVGELGVTGNEAIVDVELPSLEVVHGDMYLYTNPELRSLAGLSKLRVIEGTLFVEGNRKLTFEALSEFLQRVSIDGGVQRR